MFFRLIRLSVLLSLSVLKEKRIWQTSRWFCDKVAEDNSIIDSSTILMAFLVGNSFLPWWRFLHGCWKLYVAWPAMQWHAYKRFFAVLSGNLTPLFLRLQYIFNVFKISVFCFIFVIVDHSKANTWKCLRGKHLTSKTLKTWLDLAITSAALGRLLDARLVRPPSQAHTKAVKPTKKGMATISDIWLAVSTFCC